VTKPAQDHFAWEADTGVHADDVVLRHVRNGNGGDRQWQVINARSSEGSQQT
jgi:hypothetical protein